MRTHPQRPSSSGLRGTPREDRPTPGGHGLYSLMYAIVRHIPSGKVATYAQIARLAGVPGHARRVGYALHCLPDGSDVPWHRVVNSQGRISLDPVSSSGTLQRELLESEGVAFDAGVTIDLARFQWQA